MTDAAPVLGDNNGGDRFSKSNTFCNVLNGIDDAVASHALTETSASSLLRLIFGRDLVAAIATASRESSSSGRGV